MAIRVFEGIVEVFAIQILRKGPLGFSQLYGGLVGLTPRSPQTP